LERSALPVWQLRWRHLPPRLHAPGMAEAEVTRDFTAAARTSRAAAAEAVDFAAVAAAGLELEPDSRLAQLPAQ
jgi:hypothetical protein